MFDDAGAPLPADIEMSAPATIRSRLIHRPDALSNGLNSDDIRRKVARGEWQIVRPGVYLPVSQLPSITARQRHLMQIDAELPHTSPDAVVSHLSAACELGIDLLRIPGRRVQVTIPTAASGHRRPLLHTTRAAIDDDERVLRRGHPVTGPARTLVDIARTNRFDDALVAADSALHQGLVSKAELLAATDRAPRRAGMRQARRVMLFADGGAESVGESLSRLLIARAALPTPQIQFPVPSGDGHGRAICDFGWPEFATVGEFDGAEKYGRLLGPGERPGDAVFAEKVREDRIRDAGLVVVRWTWSDLDDPAHLADRIRRALHRGAAQDRPGAAPRR